MAVVVWAVVVMKVVASQVGMWVVPVVEEAAAMAGAVTQVEVRHNMRHSQHTI